MNKHTTFSYWIKDHGGSFKDGYNFEVAFGIKEPFDQSDIEHIAEEAAEDYHQNRDGWDCSWPITFTVATEDGKEIGDVQVERESVPHFSGRKVG